MQDRGALVEQERLVVFRQWVIAVAICGLLFGTDQIGMLRGIRGGVEAGLWLIDQKTIEVKEIVLRPLHQLAGMRQQSERIARLEDRLAATAVDQARLHELEAQVSTLESLLLKTSPEQKTERLVQLVDYGDRSVIAVGAREGVQPGQVITDKEGVLVGKIRVVGKYLSEVELLGDESSRVPVKTSNGAAKGIIEGQGNGRVVLTGVLQSELLAAGDVLVTAGSESGFPPGLVVGQITALSGRPEDVTKGGLVELLSQKEGWVALW